MNNKVFFMGNGEYSILGNQNKHENVYNNETYNYDYEDLNDSHVVLTRLVSDNAKVLDVGCATGITGTFLSKYKTKNIYGIEMDEKAIEVAKSKNIYKEIYNFAIGDKEDPEYLKFYNSKEKFDYIILADVLEHIYHPDEILIELSKKLNKDGKILVSIPNVANIDIINGLLNNNFNYIDTGLLDVTHIRFFTCNSFIDMINNISDSTNINFKIKYISSTYIKVDYMDYTAIKEFLDDNYKDLEIIQNIFEISISDKKVHNKHIKENNIVDTIENKIIERNNTINKLRADNQELRSEVERLTNELNSIVNSKRYKLVNNILNKKDSIIKKK